MSQKSTKGFQKKELPKNISELISRAEIVFPFGTHSRAIFIGLTAGGRKVICKLIVYRSSNKPVKSNAVETEINIFKILDDKILSTGISPCIGNLLHASEPLSVLGELPENCVEIKTTHFAEQEPKEFVYNGLCRFADEIRAGLMMDKYRMLFFEYYEYSLYRFCQNYVKDNIFGIIILRGILFELIYTIACLEKYFPNFRHYDLHASNVLIWTDDDYEYDPKDQKFSEYAYEGRKWYIPYYGLVPKIIDFGMSQIPSEGIRSNEIAEYNIDFYQPSSDILYLLHNIYKAVFHRKLEEIFTTLDPSSYFRHGDPQFIRDNKNLFKTTEEMLEMSIFDEYKLKIPKSQIRARYELNQARSKEEKNDSI